MTKEDSTPVKKSVIGTIIAVKTIMANSNLPKCLISLISETLIMLLATQTRIPPIQAIGISSRY